MEPREQGPVLLSLARRAIGEALGRTPSVAAPTASWLLDPGACFVTLTQDGQLRGCIGTLEAHRPLQDDVHFNALAAAFHDQRFKPLTEAELEYTRIEVSLLSTMEELVFGSQQEALTLLRPGIDGVVLSHGARRGTFLPQVWEQLPTPESFLAYLKQKAGLPASFWAQDVRLQRYTVSKWKEAA